jgi:leucyl-tRNA synthetase
MEKYNHKDIEKKWQEKWEEEGVYEVKDKVDGKRNFYALTEFTYPSGNLHVGHWYAFSVPDIFARYKRMQGFNVLFPTGFDAFGLPAENAAIKLGADPKKLTIEQMAKMRTQLRSMGAMFDWSRESVTCDPEYYRWTQWMFNQFLKNDLAYRAITKVNWCPKDQTILANEQVHDGKCERCGSAVVQKSQDQWSLRITKYADRLIDDLEKLDWPEEIKSAQKNWIGRSEGSEIEFKVSFAEEFSRSSGRSEELNQTLENSSVNSIKVFTTRADTLFGVTYVVLAPEHELISNLKSQISNWGEVEEYINETKKKSELERQIGSKDPSTGSGLGKTGVGIKGIKAVNPANGEEVSVWVADYVLAGYGTGAVMAVPAHDERDFEFARKYHISIKRVIDDNINQGNIPLEYRDNPINYIENIATAKEFCFTGEGPLINSGEFDGLTTDEAKKKITEFVGGKIVKTYRLRDWGISRQRFWGCPIPIVYDPEGKAHSIPEEHLPWLLPEDVDHTPDGTAPLARSKELLERTEKIFGKGWTPEVETMDTFVDSTWYFYRYLDNKNSAEFSSKEKMKEWMPIDLYMGGAEHTTMHLLYSRFWTKALFDLGLVNEDEAYKVRRNRGLILGPDGEKMSKSRGNVIDPDEIVERLGADTVRMYLAFMGPYGVTVNYPWDPNGVVGVRRFLERVWKLKDQVDVEKKTCRTDNLVEKTIKGVEEDIEGFKFNTAISKMMILINTLEKEEKITERTYKILLQLLSPFAPHITEELWKEMGDPSASSGQEPKSIHTTDWPKYDESKIIDNDFELVIQVNGKKRGSVVLANDTSEEEIKKIALEDESVKRNIEGKEIVKVVVVPKKLINIVVKLTF